MYTSTQTVNINKSTRKKMNIKWWNKKQFYICKDHFHHVWRSGSRLFIHYIFIDIMFMNAFCLSASATALKHQNKKKIQQFSVKKKEKSCFVRNWVRDVDTCHQNKQNRLLFYVMSPYYFLLHICYNKIKCIFYGFLNVCENGDHREMQYALLVDFVCMHMNSIWNYMCQYFI